MKTCRIMRRRFAVLSAMFLLAAACGNAAAQTSPATLEKAPAATREPDVIFVPTPQVVVDKMLELAEVKKRDVVYDLGCGNGIIVVTAARNTA